MFHRRPRAAIHFAVAKNGEGHIAWFRRHIADLSCRIGRPVPQLSRLHPWSLSESTHWTSSRVMPSGPSKNRSRRLM
jgi:hypothetical protein